MTASGPGLTDTDGSIRIEWDLRATRDPRLRQAHDYWRSRSSDGKLPARSDIDPLDVPKLLPFIFLIDVLDNPRDFRFRLVGTHIRDYMEMELTGRRIGEVFPPHFEAEVRRHWSLCVERKKPMLGFGDLSFEGRDYVTWQSILMPLSEDGESVNMLFGTAVLDLSTPRR